MLTGKKVIVGVTGSIAAYKAALLVRLLVKSGAEVKVVMTPSASRFVAPLTFSNLSQREVFTGLWDGNWTEHVHLGLWADLMIVAPATANTLAKMATGVCDNALQAVYLSARCPVLVAPAMDADMYIHPSTHRNLDLLRQDGVHLLEAATGFLASGLEGQGRMAEPEDILDAAERLLSHQDLAGKRILISAGPTREHLDPVRFLSNGSTGTMGYHLAHQAWLRGATVTLVSGPVQPDVPLMVEPVRVTSSAEMFHAVTGAAAEQDVIIMAAAVGDYRPLKYSGEKIKKGDGNMVLEMERTQDILAYLGANKPDGQVLMGFALETQHEMEHARGKLERKNLDFIVMNSLRDKGAGFGTATNQVSILSRSGAIQSFPLKSKKEVANDILDTLVRHFQPSND